MDFPSGRRETTVTFHPPRVHALLSQEVVLAAVQHTGMALFYASPALRDDNEAVCGFWMLHFTMELFGNVLQVVTAAVEQHWMALQYMSCTEVYIGCRAA